MIQNKTEIKALLNLLDDPNDIVFHHVSNKILLHGSDIIPELEKVWEKSDNKISYQRIENLINDLKVSKTKQEFRNWKNSKKQNLLIGLFLIAKDKYPEIKYKNLEKKIEKIERDIWLEINDNQTALEKVKIINKILFEHYKFNFVDSDNLSPKNLYINNFLDSKEASKILIAFVYIIVANKLNIPIKGVLMHNNLILAYID
ncbi:MAG: transglutaminase family protein, partial [Bacteroidota bacterium]|nr:transglutaminase family protein [Bacteroidota bacterium]